MSGSSSVVAGLDPGTGRVLEVGLADGVITALHTVDGDPAGDIDWIAPGLVDLQVNGFVGHDVNADPADPAHVIGLVHSLFGEGVTTLAPTVITGSHRQIAERLAAVAAARAADPLVAGAVCFVHLEGPHLSPEEGPRGAHDVDQIRPPSIEEFDDWQRACGGLIGMVTMSPHHPGSTEYIAELAGRGILVAIGHTHADGAQIAAAAAAGATLSTHLGNGAHHQLPRHPNYLWAQLANDDLTAGFIADGHHLPADTLTAMIRAKGLHRSILVSDAVSLAGAVPGSYRTPVGGEVELSADGRLSLRSSGLLAGAGSSLAAGVARAAVDAGIGLAAALSLATVNPGRFAGGRGTLVVGCRADLITFRWQPGDRRLQLRTVLAAGQQVWPRPDTPAG